MKHSIFFRLSIVPLLLTGLSMTGSAQPQTEIISPEVHGDGTVTFRYKNDQALEVKLEGDLNASGSMQRGSNGIWTRTTSPLEPGVYHYTFNVDGQLIVDPANVNLRAGLIRNQSSVLLVPGASPLPWEEHPDIPHGVVVEEKIMSRVLRAFVSCFIYLPPDYRDSNKKYPVFYLLHGGGDHAGAWVYDAYIDNVIDYLIAKGHIQPMIGVFPEGSGRKRGNVNWRDPAARAKRAKLHEQYFLTEIMPLVESNYRVVAKGSHRAISGLSMGASQTFQLALRHPHLFSFVAPLSNGASLDPDQPYNLRQVVIDNKDAINKHFNHFYIAMGKNDHLLERAQKTIAIFKELGIQHQYNELPGAHTWKFWMDRVIDFLPLFSNSIPDTP